MIKGLGCDIVEHGRVKLKLARIILTEKELIEFESKVNQIEYLASRFAAKEAIIKATNKKYLLNDIEIYNNLDGSPATNVEGITLSISHEKNYSIATAIWQ